MAKKSKLGAINFQDIVKGLLIAVSSAVLMALQQMLTKEPPSIDFKEIGVVALIAAVAYLGKQFSENSNGEILKKEK